MGKIKSVEEKLIYLENKISNLHETKKHEILKIIEDNSGKTCVELLAMIKKGWQSAGINLKNYWINRGWPESISEFKAKEYRSKNKTKGKSPFSREFYENKVNPVTNKIYTLEEADFIRNSYRPIRKEFWLQKGYSEEEAISKSIECKTNNNKIGSNVIKNKPIEFHRNKSPRCKEYYMNMGYGEEEANLLVSSTQTTFSLQKCIEKYGEIAGYKVWKDRQSKWLETLNNKSQEEIDIINKSKRAKTSNKFNSILYLIEIKYLTLEKIYYKIGITTKSIHKRYSYLKGLVEYKILYEKILPDDLSSIIETDIINKFSEHIQKDHTLAGYTECFDPELITKDLLLGYIKNACETYRHS